MNPAKFPKGTSSEKESFNALGFSNPKVYLEGSQSPFASRNQQGFIRTNDQYSLRKCPLQVRCSNMAPLAHATAKSVRISWDRMAPLQSRSCAASRLEILQYHRKGTEFLSVPCLRWLKPEIQSRRLFYRQTNLLGQPVSFSPSIPFILQLAVFRVLEQAAILGFPPDTPPKPYRTKRSPFQLPVSFESPPSERDNKEQHPGPTSKVQHHKGATPQRTTPRSNLRNASSPRTQVSPKGQAIFRRLGLASPGAVHRVGHQPRTV